MLWARGFSVASGIQALPVGRMEKDLEKLNLALIKAQILLHVGRDFLTGILLEVSRRKASGDLTREDDFSRGTGLDLSSLDHRDEEIRRILARLEKLGRPINKVA